MNDAGAGDEDYGIASSNASDAKDEKLKVVVRVRPLHKGEVSWHSDDNEAGEGDDSLLSASSSSSAPTLQNSMRIQVNLPRTSCACILSILNTPCRAATQSNSIVWEKNTQNKILTVDAVFGEHAEQDQVFQSVQGELPLNRSLRGSVGWCDDVVPAIRLRRWTAGRIRLQRLRLVRAAIYDRSLLPSRLSTVVCFGCSGQTGTGKTYSTCTHLPDSDAWQVVAQARVSIQL